MFRGDAAAVGLHNRKQCRADGVAAFLECLHVQRRRLQDVEVQVAVANVPEPAHLPVWVVLGDEPIDGREKRRRCGDAHG